MADRTGRPRNTEATTTLELTGVEQRLVDYLEDLKKKQGFGKSLSEIGRSFIWKEVNRLIEAGRLEER